MKALLNANQPIPTMPAADVFNTLLIAHLPRLRAYAMLLTRNHASADDLCQETAYRVLRAHDQFTMGTNFTAWVYRILRNEFINSLRRSKRTMVPIEEVPESAFAIEPQQETLIFTNQVIQAMGRLLPEQREVLLLVCASGLSYDQAAAEIKCSIGTVKSRIWRARQHIDAMIEQENDESRRAGAIPGSSRQAFTHVAREQQPHLAGPSLPGPRHENHRAGDTAVGAAHTV